MNLPKLLYLGLAFPPGYADVFPEAQPAGHLIETCLINSIRPWFDVRSTGITWLRLDQAPRRGTAPGLPHALNLLECKPELMHRLRSLSRLKRSYKNWVKSGWRPDLLMVCNFSPVYNAFIRWLSRQEGRPALVLYLADSVDLQRRLSWSRRFRYALKPLRYLDTDMARLYDACVAVSKTTQPVFAGIGAPWLWLPNGCDPSRAVQAGGQPPKDKTRFGYFGTLAMHGGIDRLIRVFGGLQADAELHICGWGRKKEEIQRICAADPRVRFLGARSPDECVQFARDCHVLVNPRPIVPGNENNFSSKVFEYALSGRAILTSQLSGVEDILGLEALYFDATDFEPSLAQALGRAAKAGEEELFRRGVAIQQRLLTEFNWEKQGARLRDFLLTVSRRPTSTGNGLPQ